MKTLTVGMATYQDFDGCYFTISGLRANHGTNFDLVVVDNHPLGCPRTRAVCEANGGRYFHKPNLYGTSAPRDEVFRLAETPWAMCVDSHVLFETGAIAAAIAYAEANPESKDIVSGPMVYDNGGLTTHWEPTTKPGLWGVWGYDAREKTAVDIWHPIPDNHYREPFEIPAHGLGCWMMRVKAWPGFNPLFTGFGGEEGYIHEVVRRLGGKALCLPDLRWRHRFRDGKYERAPYENLSDDHVWNALVGHREVGIDAVEAIRTDFGQAIPQERFDGYVRTVEVCQSFDQPGVRPAPMKILGIWYSNNSAPVKVLKASLDSIKRAADLSRADVTVVTCPWESILGNPFDEFVAPSNCRTGPGHLNIVRQQQQCVRYFEKMIRDREADVICFLEHDVLYPPDYFDRVQQTFRQHSWAIVVSNLDYEGMNATGWLAVRERHEPMHQLSLRYDVAIANLERAEADCKRQGWAFLEPNHDDEPGRAAQWARTRVKGVMPSIHINHTAGRLTSHGETVFHPTSGGKTYHPFWGDFAQYWDGPEVAPKPAAEATPGCGTCNGTTSLDAGPPDMETWFAAASAGPNDFYVHMPALRDLAAKCDSVTEVSSWNKPALVAMAAGTTGTVVSYATGPKFDWPYYKRLLNGRFTGNVADQPGSIDATDLLFIDTLHHADRVHQELTRYAPSVRKYLVIHCTKDPYGEIGEGGGPGVMPGVRRFLDGHREWTAIAHNHDCHGMIVLSKVEADKKQVPGTWRKAMNFSKALAKHAVDGGRLVNDRVFELRMAECLTCPERAGDACAACGCPVDKKASWASEDCGLKKLGRTPLWMATSNPEDLE